MRRSAAWLLMIFLAGCTAAPEGDRALSPILVPQLEGIIVLDTDLDDPGWATAWNTSSFFEIEDGSALGGRFPMTLRVVGDPSRLFVAVEVSNLPRNAEPESDLDMLWAENLYLYLADDQDILSRPSDVLITSHLREDGSSTQDGYWDGSKWVTQSNIENGGFAGGQPPTGRWVRGGVDGATLLWEYVIHRNSTLTEHDGFVNSGPSGFRMCLKLARLPGQAEQRAGASEDAHSDTFPGDGPTRGTELDPSTWLRFRFDY